MSTTTSLPWATSELAGADPYDSNCIETTNSATFDSTYARASTGIAYSSSGADSPHWTAATTFWFRARLFLPTNNGFYSPAPVLYFKGAGGTALFYMTATYAGIGTTTLDFQTRQGGVLTSIGTVDVSGGSTQFIDIKYVSGGSGALEVYIAGTQRASASGLAHSGGVTYVTLGCGFIASPPIAYWSEVMCDTTSLIGCRLVTDPPTGAGANTAWTGTYTEVDEAILTDADKITSTAANDIETYSGSASFSGVVRAVVVTARANCGATGPQNLQLALRTGGTNYFSSTIALGPGYQACCASWTTNPATSAAWVTATALACEFGVKAIT